MDDEKNNSQPTFDYNDYVIYAEEVSHRSLPKSLKDHILSKENDK